MRVSGLLVIRYLLRYGCHPLKGCHIIADVTILSYRKNKNMQYQMLQMLASSHLTMADPSRDNGT